MMDAHGNGNAVKQGLLRADIGLPYYTEAEGSYPNYRYTAKLEITDEYDYKEKEND